MASKFIDVEGLKTFKQETDKTYVKQEEGKSLIEDTKVTKLDGIEPEAQKNVLTEIQVNGSKIEPEGTVVNLTAEDLAADLTDYAKKADLDELKKGLGTAEKATTTTEDMATLKDTAQEGDIYKNTTDNHYYQYVGEGTPGADANGFVDLGESVELGDFATNASVEAALGKKADSETVTGQLATKADKTDLDQYTKTADLAESEELTGKFLDKETAGTTYLTQQDATDTYAKKEDLGKIQIPTCTKSELEDKKETAQSGDRYTVSDDGYHIYIFDQGEFRDTGTHVDLKDYAKTEDIASTYVKTADLQAATAAEIQALFQGE